MEHSPANERDPGWRREAVLLVAMAVVATILFAATPLDITAEHLFYRPGAVDPWPFAQRGVWAVLYGLAPWITASLVLAGLAGLVIGLKARRDAWRCYSVFVLLTVVLGPGLLINVVFKDHWDRPRPRDVVELGGSMRYVPAPLRGEGGASFPCGHCSVGFLYGIGWWIWRRHRRRLAAASLALGLLTGTVLGRMAAGGHFLSDVVWSALLAFGVAHLVYYHLLRIPAREARASATVEVRAPLRRVQIAVTVLAALGGVGVLLALFATPHGTELATDIRLSSLPSAPRVFDVRARTATVDILLVDSPAGDISITGELHGFGLPTSHLNAYSRFTSQPVPTLHYGIEQQGWFTDLDGLLTIRVPVARLTRIFVHLNRGNIKVTDATAAGVVESRRLHLDLETAAGRVRIVRSHGDTHPLGK